MLVYIQRDVLNYKLKPDTALLIFTGTVQTAQPWNFFKNFFFYDFELVFVHSALTIFLFFEEYKVFVLRTRGHYEEISLRQQPITARDFAGSNLCHIIIIIEYSS